MPDQTKGLLSPFLRGRRFNKALPFIEGKVLDYGCGVGLLANYIPDDRYVGVDTDSISIDMAKKLNPSYRFFKIMSSDYKEIKEFCPFDTIVMLAVIEHI
ncbi:MAG: methyltransferase domain-containing protein, partial [Actinomycetota bacterium]|nr:methyltransferase domain-containing protein [Actinomycetota bacterium]